MEFPDSVDFDLPTAHLIRAVLPSCPRASRNCVSLSASAELPPYSLLVSLRMESGLSISSHNASHFVRRSGFWDVFAFQGSICNHVMTSVALIVDQCCFHEPTHIFKRHDD